MSLYGALDSTINSARFAAQLVFGLEKFAGHITFRDPFPLQPSLHSHRSISPHKNMPQISRMIFASGCEQHTSVFPGAGLSRGSGK
jgi:hypothetical protein